MSVRSFKDQLLKNGAVKNSEIIPSISLQFDECFHQFLKKSFKIVINSRSNYLNLDILEVVIKLLGEGPVVVLLSSHEHPVGLS